MSENNAIVRHEPEPQQIAIAQPVVRFSDEQRKLILATCCGGAGESDAQALISIAEMRGMNPILGECYFVQRWDNDKGKKVWAVQAAIDSLRIKAEATGLYGGQDEPEYEYDPEGNVALARVRVYRKDWDRPCVGVARWDEYVQTTKDGNPTKFWRTMPHNQLGKCAEANALRKAFPKQLAKVYIPEEIQETEQSEIPPDRQLNAAHGAKEAVLTVDHLAAIAAANTDAELRAVVDVLKKELSEGKITGAQANSLSKVAKARRDVLTTKVETSATPAGESKQEPPPAGADDGP